MGIIANMCSQKRQNSRLTYQTVVSACSKHTCGQNSSQDQQAKRQKADSHSSVGSSYNPKGDHHTCVTQISDKNDLEKSLELEKRRLNVHDFLIVGKLGSGGFGSVFLVQLKHRQKDCKFQQYALKCIHLTKFRSSRMERSTKFQKFILQQIHHPFLTSLKFAFKDAEYAYLVMECGMGGPVSSLLARDPEESLKDRRVLKFKKLGEEGIRFLAANVILGLEELHRNDIMYRDLKPENVIIFQDGYAKLTDFGLSKRVLLNQTAHTEAGTRQYQAPQVVAGHSYTNSIDFWALGVFIHELATSEVPFSDFQILRVKKFKEIVAKKEKQRHLRYFQFSKELKNLIDSLLKYEPQRRLGVKGFNEIKQHSFFKGVDWDKLLAKEMVSPLLSIVQEHPIKVSGLSSSWASIFLHKSEEMSQDADWNFNSLKVLPQ